MNIVVKFHQNYTCGFREVQSICGRTIFLSETAFSGFVLVEDNVDTIIEIVCVVSEKKLQVFTDGRKDYAPFHKLPGTMFQVS